MVSLLSYALIYAKKGLMVFPITQTGEFLALDIKELGNATTNKKQIKKWWNENPTAIIGYTLPSKSLVFFLEVHVHGGTTSHLIKNQKSCNDTNE